jgi:Fe-S cluster biosynthesis and repair protein YggX
VHIQGFSYVICVKEALDWERIPKQLAKGKFTVFAMIAWGLWKNRNAMAIKLKFCRDLSNLPHTIFLLYAEMANFAGHGKAPLCAVLCILLYLYTRFHVPRS